MPRADADGPTDLDATVVDPGSTDVDSEDDGDTRAATRAVGSKGGDPLAPGRMLGEYKIAKTVGIGGMGVVLGAIHPLIGKRVAIKVLKTDDPVMLARFVDEATIVNQIRHPNIVDVFGFGTLDDGRKYFVMEWLDGESLRERVSRGPMPLEDVIHVMRPLVRALAAAHAKNVVHRDLKPENVFLTKVTNERPLIKLLDFGIAKFATAPADPADRRTAIGEVVGTPMYAAPEQSGGRSVDHRSDIYALGCVLFEMLTGRPPFLGEGATSVIALHMIEDAPHPASFVTVPRELDALVVAMLAKEPERRPALTDVLAIIDLVERGTADYVRLPEPPRSSGLGRLDQPTMATPVNVAPVSMPMPAMPQQTAAMPVTQPQPRVSSPRVSSPMVPTAGSSPMMAAAPAYPTQPAYPQQPQPAPQQSATVRIVVTALVVLALISLGVVLALVVTR